MIPFALILYGGDDDTYGDSRYGAGSDGDRYGEDRYSMDILSYGDGGVGDYVNSVLDGPTYDDDVAHYETQDTYGGGGSYGGFLDLSVSYLGSYKPKYGL